MVNETDTKAPIPPPELPARILVPALRRGAVMSVVFMLVSVATNVGMNKSLQNVAGVITIAIGGFGLGLGYAPVSIVEGLTARKPTIPRLLLCGLVCLLIAEVIVLFAGLQGYYSSAMAKYKSVDLAWEQLKWTLVQMRDDPLWPLSFFYVMAPIAVVIPLRARKVRFRLELPLAIAGSQVFATALFVAFQAGGQYPKVTVLEGMGGTLITTVFLVLAFRLSDWVERRIEAALASKD